MNFGLGAHIDSSEGILKSAIIIKKINGNVLQLFVKHDEKEADKFKEYITENKICVIIHAPFTINLASDWDKYSWWIKYFILQIEMAGKMGASGIVIHLGKQLKLTIEESYNNMFSALLYVHNQTKEFDNIKIIIETSSGQGSELCYKLEDLAYFFKKFSKNQDNTIKKRFRICLDTCHLFAAGYDLRNTSKIKLFLEAFEELIGLRYVALIHLNDSQNKIGSNIDRHANIGEGYIGKDNLIEIFKYFRKINVPVVLETPTNSVSEINLLNKIK